MKKGLAFILFFTCLSSIQDAKAQENVYWASEVLDVSSQLSNFEYSASTLLGRPRVLPQTGDNPNSWMPRRSNTKEYVHVAFDTAIQIQQIAIAETFNPSALTEIYAYDEEGNEYFVSRNRAGKLPLEGRMLNIFVELTDYKVKSLKLHFDGSLVEGYYAIDAIGISASSQRIIAKPKITPYLRSDIVTERLNENVNSEYQEMRPLLSPDGKRLYFTRRYHPDNMGGTDDHEDIWYSDLDEETGEWLPAVNPGSPLNTAGPNFINSITPDGESIVVVLGNRYRRNDKVKPGISIANKNPDGSWSEPVDVEIEKANITNIDGAYFLANNRKIMILAVDRYDALGERDLYVSFLQENGKWSEPLNLGSDVNTPADETSPYLAADNETLYFSSKGFSGYGGMDIYISRRLDDTWTNWTEPENLGPDINSSGDDVFFNIPPSGKLAYYSKGVDDEDADIYNVELPVAYRPLPVVKLEGILADAQSREPLMGRIQYFLQPENTEIGFALTEAGTGRYDIILPYGSAYRYIANADGYATREGELRLDEAADYEELRKDIFLISDATMAKIASEEASELEETESSEDESALIARAKDQKDQHEKDSQRKDQIANDESDDEAKRLAEEKADKEKGLVKLSFDNIYFDFDKATLKQSAYPVLNQMIAAFQANKQVIVRIEGHTDSTGPEEYNLGLSRRRAEAVKNYLRAEGIDTDRIETRAYGENRPKASNETIEGRKQNRRVEFVVEQK
ncbi:MAG: OmpA family protein [Cyclobacteriaceae bacterium]|nr:OmpA family protein [Cyclobacteriaceae bacterium]MCH8516611.1 OmpA family protein [Cyclobacteriaceae bacterium]